MQENNIKAEKITKPIQLLAAWLTGLILLVGSLLTASATIKSPTWLAAFFGISAVSIIPLFLILIFLLQTKYRPQMQEDSFYSKYLDQNTLTFRYEKEDSKFVDATELKEEVILLSQQTKDEIEKIRAIIQSGLTTKSNENKIEEIIENSDNKLDELKKIAKFSSLDLQINNKLASYSQIVELITSIGFIKFKEFGHDKAAPTTNIISIGKDVPMDVIKSLVFGLIPLGITHIRKTKSLKREDNRVFTIYIGSYAIDNQITLITEEVINKLSSIDNSKTIEDLLMS